MEGRVLGGSGALGSGASSPPATCRVTGESAPRAALGAPRWPLRGQPEAASAFQACGARFGFGGARGGFRGGLSRTNITKYVACVRQHGYNLPNPNFSGKGPVYQANIRNNAKFQAASRACQGLLLPPRGSAPPGGTSTTAGA